MVPRVSAQMVEIREYRGKEIACARSGLMGFAMPCGTDGGYAYVFIGSVLSAAEISETEKRLLLVPEEVFSGDVPDQVTVTTNQGACLPDIQPGDRWLFYLQSDNETNELFLGYGSPSGPVTDTQKSIATLRRLAQIPGSGIIRGQVVHPVWNEADKAQTYPAVPNHKLVAKRIADGAEYATRTDSDGRYEFEPLPAGSYNLTANTAQGLWAEEGRTDVHSHGCSHIGFALHPDAMISGRVTTADGKPVRYAQVEVMPASAEGSVDIAIGGFLFQGRFTSAVADEHGYFEVRGLHPGGYLVGIGIAAQDGSLEWQSRVYYPGVPIRDMAVIVELGQAGRGVEINFRLPAAKGP